MSDNGNMEEIGGYIGLDTYSLPMLHENAIALNSGRNALVYLILARGIKKIRLPKYICDSIITVCDRLNIIYEFYNIGADLLPLGNIRLDEDEWLYFINYFSQFDNSTIVDMINKHKRVIVDNAQSYFQEPIERVDTIYTCRKYFGVSDGAFLYTNSLLDGEIQSDYSYNKMQFLLGRYEMSASQFYDAFRRNEMALDNEPMRKMSKLTYNLLHAIDYKRVEETRKNNYSVLYNALININRLKLSTTTGTFMYPLLIRNGREIRKKLHEKKIYVPTLWPNVLDLSNSDEWEYELASDLLPLPIDQRYTKYEMKYMIDVVLSISM